MNHNWKYEYTSYTDTSGYCIVCGMRRYQTYSTNWISRYFINGVRQKVAGDCKQFKRDRILKELGI